MRNAAAFLFAGLLLSVSAIPASAGQPDNAAARR